MARTIVIGDVHGCATELGDLLSLLAVSASDRIFFVGDLVGRGPDPRAVLAIVRKYSAVAVQGNHERRILEVHRSGMTGRRSRLGPGHRRMIRSFTEQDWRTMEDMPMFAELPEHRMVVVHAGLVPNVPLAEQDPWVLTHLRSFDESGAPSHRDGSVSWAAAYEGPTHVVFGHNAVRGIQVHPFATGLDSGCVYGGRLSALVLQMDQTVPPVSERDAAIVSVPARFRYFDPSQ